MCDIVFEEFWTSCCIPSTCLPKWGGKWSPVEFMGLGWVRGIVDCSRTGGNAVGGASIIHPLAFPNGEVSGVRSGLGIVDCSRRGGNTVGGAYTSPSVPLAFPYKGLRLTW